MMNTTHTTSPSLGTTAARAFFAAAKAHGVSVLAWARELEVAHNNLYAIRAGSRPCTLDQVAGWIRAWESSGRTPLRLVVEGDVVRVEPRVSWGAP